MVVGPIEVALVTSVLNTLLPKIFSFLQENHELQPDLELDIQYIRHELGMIAAAIEEHDRRSWRDGIRDDVERFWIHGVRDLAYSMEDSMDRFLHRVSLELGASSLRQKGHRLMTVKTRNKFAAKIRELKKKSEEASRLRAKYTYGGQPSTTGASASSFTVYDDTHVPEEVLVGMDVPRKELLDLVREGEDHPKHHKVISIVGFGGLGKTVLARQVYNCVEVDKQYELLVWVRASDKSAGDVLKEILQQAQVGMTQVLDGNCDVSKLLKGCLQSKRFFIVLDDMQTEYWNTIKNAFPRDAGVSSRVVVTTAIHSIANACSSVDGHIYLMRPLDKEHSSRLFFMQTSKDSYRPAEPVVEKCNGLPLALVTTAQFLQSKDQLTPKGCEDLCRYMGERVEKQDTLARMKHVLLHSYSSLPGHVLKACLLYVGIFPSDRPIRRKCLIRRWLAEGFVETDHRRSAPVVALDNFKELMNRSIIQPIDMGNNTEAKTCQTHSMMLEFILQKSMCENVFTLVYGHESEITVKIRRLSVHYRGASGTRGRKKLNIDFAHVRSLTIFGEADEHLLDFGKYKLLRVLDLQECEALNNEHFKKICNQLILLRYLSIGANITTIPKEISKLKFLETLNVRRAKAKILPVPIEVVMLPCLIHLLGVLSLPGIGLEMSKHQATRLENSNLQTLAGFVADQSPVLLQLMCHMNSLTKVKLWFQPTGDGSSSSSSFDKPIQEFIQRGTDLNEARSLSLSFEGCSQGFLDFPLPKENSYHVSSLKLHGDLRSLPPFVAMLASITELCLSSPGELSGDVLASLSSARGLHYLKLIARRLGKLVVEQGAFGSLRRLCIVAQSMTSLENREGALPHLESLSLLCEDLSGLCGVRIDRLGRLKEVALGDGVNEETKEQWKAVAKAHPRRPRVSLVKKKEVGVARETSENPVASAPEAGALEQLNRGPETSAVRKLAGRLRWNWKNGTSTEMLCAGTQNGHNTISTEETISSPSEAKAIS